MNSRKLIVLAVSWWSAALMAQAADRPNILFALADDASWLYMGAYGCKFVKTPAFDRVAKEGLLFNRAYTPNAKCAPSRACILTGRNSWQLEEAANHDGNFPAKFKTYVEALSEHGYFVGKTAKGWGPGNAGQINGKARQLAGPSFDKQKIQPETSGISATDYAGNFEDFLNASESGKPWCFWYGGLEPHRAYEYGSGVSKGGKKLADVGDVLPCWPDNEQVRNDLLDYAFEIEHFDHHLGKMLALLEARGQLENTIVVVTADNGMPFPKSKGQEYELSNHLPLAVRWPKGIQSPGRVVEDFVSFIDLAPTFLEMAGVSWLESGMASSPGRSLGEIFKSDQGGQVVAGRDHVLIGKERHDVGRPHDWGYPIRGIVKDGWLYLQNFEPSRWPAGNPETGYLNCDGGPTKTEVLKGRLKPGAQQFWQWSFGIRDAEELYQVGPDPACLNNRANDPNYADLKAKLQEQLFRELKEQSDPRMFGLGKIFDEYPYANPAVKGFYERFMSGEPIKASWVNASDFEKEPIEATVGNGLKKTN